MTAQVTDAALVQISFLKAISMSALRNNGVRFGVRHEALSGPAASARIPDIQAPIRQAPKRTVRNHHELMEFPPTRVHSPLGCIKAAPSENVS